MQSIGTRTATPSRWRAPSDHAVQVVHLPANKKQVSSAYVIFSVFVRYPEVQWDQLDQLDLRQILNFD